MITEATRNAHLRADANRRLVSDIIRAAIDARGLTNERFAEETGVTKQVVSKWAKYGAEIPASILGRMRQNERQWVRDMADEIVNVQFGHLLSGIKED